MPNFYFQLGSTPELSWQELQSVFPSQKMDKIANDLIKIELPDKIAAQKLINILGGTIKILHELSVTEILKNDQVAEKLASLVLDLRPATFAIAEWGRDHLPKIEAAEIKSLVKTQGFTPSYKEQNRHGLSAALLLHHQITEIIVIQTAGNLIFAETVAVQDIDEWTNRDRNKPYYDRKKGMLPPKVARMMVNIALEESVLDDTNHQQIIFDPFCGSGTVLLESLTLDRSVIGSDLDPESVMGTKHNIEWLRKEYNLPTTLTSQIFIQDATQPLPSNLKSTITHLVTEPFLGKPTPREIDVANIFKGLEKLYLGVFKQWKSVLVDDATIVIVFPLIETSRQTYKLEGLIDKLANLGYTTVFQPIVYKRPQAIVQRQIIKFKYQKKVN